MKRGIKNRSGYFITPGVSVGFFVFQCFNRLPGGSGAHIEIQPYVFGVNGNANILIFTKRDIVGCLGFLFAFFRNIGYVHFRNRPGFIF